MGNAVREGPDDRDSRVTVGALYSGRRIAVGVTPLTRDTDEATGKEME
jgi:hypothetical protein